MLGVAELGDTGFSALSGRSDASVPPMTKIPRARRDIATEAISNAATSSRPSSQ